MESNNVKRLNGDTITPQIKGPNDELFQAANKAYFNGFRKMGVIPRPSDIIETHETLPHVCAQCSEAYPTPHLLDMHVAEIHDSYFEALVRKGEKPMYACFFMNCSIKSYSYAERNKHCVKVHKFPKNFRWFQLRKKEQDRQADMDPKKEQSNDNVAAAKVEKAAPSHYRNFTFGHHRVKAFQGTTNRKGPEKTVKALENLTEMNDALDEV
ncbi:protein lethal(2)k10201-like [Teleopsis dalmanni]|uniref:protein lethal(2)k10201-like n=1 Tax=Teleopsis dalmanni TaxID=139649 RepID=UPI0018CD0BDD|nr:protein lethal(2)k10201-like [Teleopsis dalmanni]